MNMDSNDNNNRLGTVQLELMSLKSGVKEEVQDMDTNRDVTQDVDTSNDSNVSGKKRKHPDEDALAIQEQEDGSDTSSSSKTNSKRIRNSNCLDQSATNAMDTTDIQDGEGRPKFIVVVRNNPGEWTSQEVIDYIKDECGIHISKICDNRENDSEDFQIKLKFSNKEHLDSVLMKLKLKEVDRKLTAQVEDINEDSQSDGGSDNISRIEESSESNTEQSQVNELEDNAYYIKDDFLYSLGLKLPLTNWVTVSNFRCDKSELKEVLELSGKVVICSVVTTNIRYANVMFSHPLEAVQAISMLNGQKLYGKQLKVAMINAVDTDTLLPKGLSDVGPGLGKYGKPLPDLLYQYKKFMKGQRSTIDAHLFRPELLSKIGVSVNENYVRPANNISNTDDNTSEQSRESSPSVQNLTNQFGPIGQRPPAPQTIPVNRPRFQNSRAPNPVIRMNGPMLPRGLNNPVRVPMQGGPAPPNMYQNCPPIPGIDTNNPRNFNAFPMGVPMVRNPQMIRPSICPNTPAPRFPGTVTGMISVRTRTVVTTPMGSRGPGPHGLLPSPNVPVANTRPCAPFRPQSGFAKVQMFKGSDPVTLQISNLPPTTNFVNLGRMLSELGHVVFLEFTTPGCAIVRFASPSDAERCFQNYRNIMG